MAELTGYWKWEKYDEIAALREEVQRCTGHAKDAIAAANATEAEIQRLREVLEMLVEAVADNIPRCAGPCTCCDRIHGAVEKAKEVLR